MFHKSKLKTFKSESNVDTDETRLVIDTSSAKVGFKIKSNKNTIFVFGLFLKLSKQKEPEAQIQIEKENPEIPESNTGNPDASATNDNEELSLEDEIQIVLEAAKDLPDLPPDAPPSPEKPKNTDKPKSCNDKIDSETVTRVSATPDLQGVPDLESVPKENPNLEIETRDKSTGTNFTGIQIKKKEMAMFWDGEMVESENIPEIVFTKERYHLKLLQSSPDISITDVSGKSPPKIK